MTKPLSAILAWYKATNDSMRVTRRALHQAIPGAITDKYVFYTLSEADADAMLDNAQQELNRLVILAMVAVFERTLRDSLRSLPMIALPAGDPLLDRVRDEILKDIEFWNISSRVVDLFAMVDPGLRGQVKQIIEYRNWVAHGRTLTEPAPVKTTPAVAYKRLTDFLTQAGVVTP